MVFIKFNRAGYLHVLAVIGEQRLPIDNTRFPHSGKSIRRTSHTEVHESHAGRDRPHAGYLASDSYLLTHVFARLGMRNGDGVEL